MGWMDETREGGGGVSRDAVRRMEIGRPCV